MANAKKTAPTLTKSQAETYAELDTKSAQIRYLKSEGLSTADIARYMNIRYQHARNVLITPLKSA